MAQEKNIFDPEIVLPKLKNLKDRILDILSAKKKLLFGVILIAVVLSILGSNFLRQNPSGGKSAAKTVSSNIGKSFDFPALNNSGKLAGNNKIRLTIASAEKTNQVLVNDKVYTAKNNKLFLIVNLEFKNDISQPLNILPGDLIRLSYNGDESNKFAPDLHNNLVPVAAISTKLDRVGFVITENAKDFKLYIGELEGKKEVIQIAFPS
ncbi:hypothetical protein HZB96_01385 [Candidatus Gottesmanbacteria bacterium]|nr:hypothetical protein [Candidatus Gottesmanbacteria bacterium]